MSKSLKSLENIRYIIVFDERLVDEDGDDDPKKIFIDEICPQDYAIIKKELKALQIIKEKRVNVRAFLKCCHRVDGLLIYNNQCDNRSIKESKELTQEEYDILKEVLL